MARKTPPLSPPQRPVKSIEEKRQDIARLQRRIEELKAFDPSIVTKRFNDPDVTALEKAIGDTLAAVFGHRTIEYNNYSRATHLDHGPVHMDWAGSRQRDKAAEAQQYLAEGKAGGIALLEQAVRSLKEEIEFAAPEAAAPSDDQAPPVSKLSRRIFIVHGHDNGAKETVARYLSTIGFDPIILHEQANKGQTVIEKIESSGNVGFAVVLLTPDDEGAKKGESPTLRARQNVLLELGYFIGRLGRSRVCVIRKGEVDIPTDFAGAIYQPMDEAGAWKQSLALELQAVGYEIDWNTLMRR